MKHPEIPLMIFPSHIQLLGVDAALLLSIVQQRLQLSGRAHLSHSREKWLNIAPHWRASEFESLLQILVEQRMLAVVHQEQVITVSLFSESAPAPQAAPSKPKVRDVVAPIVQPAPTMQTLPVFDAPPLLPVPTVAAANTLKGRGPAPTFGGSIGWKKRSADELQQVFAQQEELNKQLYHMTMDWKPSEMFYNTLTRNAIPKEFALRCLDEFVLYYSDGKKKERSWDQKFLAWVKRDWIKQQGKDNRSNEPKQSSGYQHENSQRDSREKRKRITAAIMDINDTDW